jgi:hypothetical protein
MYTCISYSTSILYICILHYTLIMYTCNIYILSPNNEYCNLHLTLILYSCILQYIKLLLGTSQYCSKPVYRRENKKSAIFCLPLSQNNNDKFMCFSVNPVSHEWCARRYESQLEPIMCSCHTISLPLSHNWCMVRTNLPPPLSLGRHRHI